MNVQVSLVITRGLGSTDRIRDIGEARSIEVRLGRPISDCVLADMGRYKAGILVRKYGNDILVNKVNK